MTLSAELFRSLLTALRPQGRRRKLDLRNQPRIGVRARAAIMPLVGAQQHEPVMVTVRDLSPEGIGIVHTESFGSGEQFVFCIPPVPGDDGPRGLLCTVTGSRPAGAGLFTIGARFVLEVTPQDHAW